MILSIDAEKAFYKIQHLFLLNPLKCRNRWYISQDHKSLKTMKNLQQILFQWGKAGSLSLKIRNTTRMPTLATIIQHVLEVLATAIGWQKGIKGIQIGKEEVKFSLFADDITLYMENPKDITSKLLELRQQFSSVAGYKINAQKSVAFHTWIMRLKKEKLGNPSHLQ